VDRQPGAHLLGRDGESFDLAALGVHAHLVRHDGQDDFVRAGKDLAEPSHASRDREHDPEDADRGGREQAREHQRDSGGEHDRPSRGRGQLDLDGRSIAWSGWRHGRWRCHCDLLSAR
jgi:hypothetical protein